MFEDWWKAMKLYLKANKVTDTEKKIITILDRFREGMLWEPQKGKSFPSIWTLNPKPQDIQ